MQRVAPWEQPKSTPSEPRRQVSSRVPPVCCRNIVPQIHIYITSNPDVDPPCCQSWHNRRQGRGPICGTGKSHVFLMRCICKLLYSTAVKYREGPRNPTLT